MAGGRPKGIPKTGGRQKGTPNKTTAQVRDAIVQAFHEAGGKDYLVKLANTAPAVFCQLLSRILPQEMKLDAEVRNYVIRAPAVAESAAEWQKQHEPRPTLQ